MKTHTAARGLGWFSIAIGLAELAMTKKVSKAMQLEKRPGLVRSCGARELATGIGILTRKQTGRWIWARVAGDVMDLAALGTAFAGRKRKRGKIALAAAAVAGVTMLDLICGKRMRREAKELRTESA